MGNSLCCSQNDHWNEINDGVIPIDTKKRLTYIKPMTTDNVIESSIEVQDHTHKRNKSAKRLNTFLNREQPNLAFELNYDFPIK